jgi:hypothetical protein
MNDSELAALLREQFYRLDRYRVRSRRVMVGWLMWVLMGIVMLIAFNYTHFTELFLFTLFSVIFGLAALIFASIRTAQEGRALEAISRELRREAILAPLEGTQKRKRAEKAKRRDRQARAPQYAVGDDGELIDLTADKGADRGRRANR